MKTIYTNGNIITLEKETGNSLVEENGRIIKIGEYQDIYEVGMNVVDLKGKTLIPAFIDAHSHISGYATSMLQVALDKCTCIQDILDEIEKNKSRSYIVCKGYDQHRIKENRHITREELDQISSTKPIIVQHQTGHMGVMNTPALELLNINKDTHVDGGTIDYEHGILEENAFTNNVIKFPMPSMEELIDVFKKAQYDYASYGITTAQDGMIMDELTSIYQVMLNKEVFYLDIVGYPSFNAKKFMNTFKEHKKQYKKNFKIGGYKMFIDGSPQNKTAWTIDPYVDGTYGYPTLTDNQILECISKAIEEDMQVLSHCNGDQAIEHYIQAYDKLHKQDIRPVIVHAQMMRENQIRKAKELLMIPSYYVAHVYYFGDIHKENMGDTRAKTISPLQTSLKHHLLFTLHQDAPVIEPNMLETIDIAVNRRMMSGDILGKEECISPLEALRAVTINSAYQYFEEDEKGSLKVGKKADMVILSDNLLTSHHIKDIEVLETIKDGKVIYKKES